MSTTRTEGRPFTAKWLKATCRDLRARLVGEQLATEEEIAPYAPGGTHNRFSGRDALIEYYAQLKGLSRRVELQDKRQNGATDEQLEATVRGAIARQPVPVVLSLPGEHNVYQKSAWALAFLDSLEATARPLALLQAQFLEGTVDEAHAAVRGLPALALLQAWRTFAWILLSDDVGLPFDERSPIEPPEWTTLLLWEDFIAIWSAHRKLHYDATMIMVMAMPHEPGEPSKLSLSGFLGGYASEKGIEPSVIMRRWGFPEALAAAVAAAETHRVAMANAERDRDRKGQR